ncbi:P-loop containing nucleoside triphosphate hydrolase protein [Paraphysoderma sedebokerense]|nr:P-loop containing nucleoside triphosphate hydrolase protein [Paraphysoderma sedebokerense]
MQNDVKEKIPDSEKTELEAAYEQNLHSIQNDAQSQRKLIPEATANVVSWTLFSWMTGIMFKGYKRPLQHEDMYRLSDQYSAELLCEQFELLWKEEEERTKKILNDASQKQLTDKQKKKLPKVPSLFRTLFKAFGWKWVLAGLLKFVGDIAQTTSPLLLRYVIQFIAESQPVNPSQTIPPEYVGYLLVVGMFLLQMVGTITVNVFFQVCMSIGVKVRTALTTAIFRKALKLSPKARIEWNVGKVTNVMSTDVNRVDMVTPYLHFLWSAPLQIVICLALLIFQLGPSALAGLGLMIIFGPIQGKVMSMLSQYRKDVQKITDERVKLMNESLQGIKIIKFFAYEPAFLDSIAKLRLSELSLVRRLAVWRAGIFGFAQVVPVFASIMVFVIYAAVGNTLTPAIVFSSLALFNALRLPLMFLPMMIAFSVDGKVAADRIAALLNAEELDSQPARLTSEEATQKGYHWSLKVSSANFLWETESDPSNDDKSDTSKATRRATKKSLKKQKSAQSKSDGTELVEETKNEIESVPLTETVKEKAPTLQNIDIEVKKGALVAVVGRVGCGKSSLLSGMVGEMKKLSGEVQLVGKVGYCPQQPWIQNATLKENILFGLPYDEVRYKNAVHYAALERDLQILPDGDQTEIGEKGINLSGGQKSRINVARAIYFNPDIILLDDVLSAVDSHVGSFLFNTTIKNALSGKTRILVTHALHFVPQCDYVIHLENGKIIEQGPYQTLMESNGKFSEMMKEYGGVESQVTESPTHARPSVEATKKEQEKPDDKGKPKQLMTAEERAVGAVAATIYLKYFQAMGGPIVIFLLLLLLLLTQVTRVGNDLWLAWWTSNVFTNLTLEQYMGIYFAWGVAQAFCNVLFGVNMAYTGTTAAKNLHISALAKVLYSPMSFFDTTPLGRIINRFSKDQDAVDNTLADSFRMFLTTLASSIATFALIGVATPLFLIPLGVLLPIYYYIQLFFRATTRELKRLDSLKRSPLYAQFGESLTGIVTIRAYAEEERFSKVNKKYMEENNEPYFLWISAARWLSVRLETIGGLLIFFAGLFGVISRTTVSPSLIGLSLSYALQVTGVLNWCVRQASEVESQMNAVERIAFYSELQTEADPILPDKRPAETWPSEGHVKIDGLEMAYRDGLPNVLHGINLDVPGGSKVGIVGRTGSGKSSIIVALLRLVEYKGGKITIDGIDISQIGLRDLRSRVAIIPQDPVLFAGTIRSNLDRFNKYTDEALWKTLERVGLKDFVSGLDAKLDAPVTENGENLSVGQRQLLCLARAMIVDAKVAILDEATASVDMQTDAVIQRSIRRDFKGSTILTIAHRLNTIIDYDYILVLDAGRVKEFAPPDVLLSNPKSAFSSMVDETGASNAALLRKLAKEKKLELDITVEVVENKKEDTVGESVRNTKEGVEVEVLSSTEENVEVEAVSNSTEQSQQ